MKLTTVSAQNFRGIEELEIPLDPQLNVIIGDNGSGKSALLEAINLGISSYFIGIQHVPVPSIKGEQVRILSNQEYALPVTINCTGIVDNKEVLWSREKTSIKGGLQTRKSNIFKSIGAELQSRVRNNDEIILPVISYYSSLRNNSSIKVSKLESLLKKPKGIGSRFRGYIGALSAIADLDYFQYWFISKELSQLQKREKDLSLDVVKNVIINSLPKCVDVFYDFNPDVNTGISLKFEDGKVLSFNMLSDGVRSFFALISDLAWRCAKLNPHLGQAVFFQTNGIVLIDELDLHLHPNWQKMVLNSLMKTFPKIQFIVTTHSPFIIQETERGQLLLLENCKLKGIKGASDLSIEDIAEFIQGVAMPQWSSKKSELFEKAKIFYSDLASGKPITKDDEQKLVELIKPFSQNPAFDALMEQERLKKSDEG